MTEFSTVRIDVESKAKLEEIADVIGASFNINISKATALKIIIDDAYETQVTGPRRFVDNLKNKNNENGKGE